MNRDTFLPAPPDELASLVDLQVTGATLERRINPRTLEYSAIVTRGGPVTLAVRTASSRVRGITIDGRPASSRTPVTVEFTGAARTVPIVVTAADGQTRSAYQLTFAPR